MRLTPSLVALTLTVSPLAALAGPVTPDAVVAHYTNIAAAAYDDSVTTAQALQQAVAALVAQPSEATLGAARSAWTAARVPYQQTEAFRFGNPIVDEWEGKVNAWYERELAENAAWSAPGVRAVEDHLTLG